MTLYIKQKVFTFGDKFTVCNAQGEEKYFVEGEVFTWGKKLHVYDCSRNEVAFIKQELFTFRPAYQLLIGGKPVATIRKEWTFMRPKYTVEGMGWTVEGNFFAHDYQIRASSSCIASIRKEWMSWGDSYALEIADSSDEIAALAVVLTIDCVIDSQNNSSD